ncbi:hypothetical protein BC831DRAFT_441392 [Entophlyctis helioformis]|nr:hypothetical protein BC831DRAFT_441392 [Entophlyctis helioformis]
MFLRRSVALVGRLSVTPAAPARAVAVRAFSVSTAAKSDFINNMYIKHIREYKPPKETDASKVDLAQTVTAPKPPAKPELETAADAAVQAGGDVALEEEAWPALYNPIDDPANFPDAWNYATTPDNGELFPSRTREYDWHHAGGH